MSSVKQRVLSTDRLFISEDPGFVVRIKPGQSVCPPMMRVTLRLISPGYMYSACTANKCEIRDIINAVWTTVYFPIYAHCIKMWKAGHVLTNAFNFLFPEVDYYAKSLLIILVPSWVCFFNSTDIMKCIYRLCSFINCESFTQKKWYNWNILQLRIHHSNTIFSFVCKQITNHIVFSSYISFVSCLHYHFVKSQNLFLFIHGLK